MSSRPSRGAARLASILDALPDALLLVNANGTVVNANAIALETFETPGTALVGRGLLDLLPSFDPKRIPGSMRSPREAEEDTRTKPTRMTARRTDGTEFPVQVTSANLEDGRTPYDDFGDGIPHFTGDELLMLVVRDLSGTVDTEAELARQQRQTEMILRAAAEGVVGVDTAGKIVLVNPSAAQILGHRATDLGGKELHPLVHHSRPDGSPLAYEETPLADTLRSGRKHRVRGQVLWRKDGKAVPVDLTTAPVRDGEQLVGAVMTFTDRTQYDALAARGMQLRALLDVSLRGPLAELRGELTGLAADPAGQLWPEANQILHHLSAGYARITTLIDNVLAFQRLDRGEDKLNRAPAGLDDVIGAAVDGAVELIGPGRAQYAVHAPPIQASVDAPRMVQALAHLIADVAGVDSAGNAIAFSGDSTIVVAAAQRGDVVRIDVRGPSAGGDPVHLPLARGIVERHGGVLQTHEVPGQGSAYVLEVPVGPGSGSGGGRRAAAEGTDSEGRGPSDGTETGTSPGAGTSSGTRGRSTADDTQTVVAPWAIPATADQSEAPTGRRRALRRPEETPAAGAGAGGGPGAGAGAAAESVQPTGRRARRARSEERGETPAEDRAEPERRREIGPGPNALPAADAGGRSGARGQAATPAGEAGAGGRQGNPGSELDLRGGQGNPAGQRGNPGGPFGQGGQHGNPAAQQGNPGGQHGAPGNPFGQAEQQRPDPSDPFGQSGQLGAVNPGGLQPDGMGTPGNQQPDRAGAPGGQQSGQQPGQHSAPGVPGVPLGPASPSGPAAPPAPQPDPMGTPGGGGQPALPAAASAAPTEPEGTGRRARRALEPAAPDSGPAPVPPQAPHPPHPPHPAQSGPQQPPQAPGGAPTWPTPGSATPDQPPGRPALPAAQLPAQPSWPQVGPSAPLSSAANSAAPAGPPAASGAPDTPNGTNADAATPPNAPANAHGTAGTPSRSQDPSHQSHGRAISVRTLGQGVPFAMDPHPGQTQTPTQSVQAQNPHGLPAQVAAGGSGRRRRLAPPQNSQPQQSHILPQVPSQLHSPGGEAQARQHPQADPDSGQLPTRAPDGPQQPVHQQPQPPVQPSMQPLTPPSMQPPTQPHQPPQAQPAPPAPQPQHPHRAQHAQQQPPPQQQSQPPSPPPGPEIAPPRLATPQSNPLPPHAPGRSYAIGAPAEGAAEGPELLDGPNGAVDVTDDHQEEPLDEPRRLLVWPEPDISTRQALTDRGYRPVIVRSREEVDAQIAEPPAALFVDPLTGPITRTALQSLRQAAAAADVPVLVTAGLGQATREAAYGADPAVLLKALAPRDSEQHPPRVLLVESHAPIAQAFAATLERRGMQVTHADSETDAMTKAAQVHPNLVVMDLMLIRRRRQGIVDWLRGNGRLNNTPLVVYTSADIDPAELPRLASGETVLFLAERSTSTDVQSRIVDLLGKIGT
ncbi:PAS domain-containing protein [Streptomyces polygonati]|uniref:PAS domain-containing protein n=1 Tax=Streptomyces polygonati TaxID=1617087 RepID=A0ABV8HQT5_9ACTN